MNCAEIRLLLHAHADGELDAANSLELERHLKTCATCAADNKSLQSLRTALRGEDLNFRAPDSLKRDLRQFVHDLSEEKNPRKEFNPQWLWKLLAFGATAFALLAIFLRPAGISAHRRITERSRRQPCSLVAGGTSHRCRLERPAHRQAVVRWQTGFRAGREGFRRARFSAGRWAAGLSEWPHRGRARVSAQ